MWIVKAAYSYSFIFWGEGLNCSACRPFSLSHTHLPLGEMYGSTAAHCVYFVGCMAAWLCVQRQERKIGGGEWLHQESRRRVERREGGQFPFCNTHATWTHRESGERKENNKREKEREKETLQPRRPSVRPPVRPSVGWLALLFLFFLGGGKKPSFL